MGAEPPGPVGRTDELALVNGAIGDVMAGRGRPLLVEGEPGIGKTTLVRTGVSGVPRDRCEVLWGNCDELGQRFPLSVMIGLLGVDAGATDPRRAEAAAALAEPTSAAAWAVRVAAGDPVTAAIEQLSELVDRLCGSGPLIVVLEDLHWADEATLVLWRRLGRASVQLPLLLIGTCRPVPRRPELGWLRREAGIVVPLGRLAEGSVVQLAAEHAGGSPGPRLRERLRSAAGNPLYVRELISVSARAGVLELQDGTAELVPGGVAPTSLVATIADRLDFLSDEARDVLRPATLLGSRFTVAELAAVSGGDLVGVLGPVQEALDAGVLEQRGALLRFRHGLLKEAVYEATPQAIRSALHHHVARVLMDSGAAADRIAETLLLAPPTPDGWELDWLARHAGELTTRAPEIVAGLLENALRRTGPLDARHVVFADRLVSAYSLLGRHEQTVGTARDILARTTDPERTGHAVWLLGHALLDSDEVEDAEKAIDDYLSDDRADARWAARINALRSVALARRMEFAAARAASDRALAGGADLADPSAAAYGLHVGSMISMHDGDVAGALGQVDRALALTEGRPELARLRLLLLSDRAPMVEELGRPDEAVEALRHARRLGERTASPQLAGIRLQAAQIAFLRGAWDDVTTELESLSEVSDHRPHALRRHALIAVLALRRDDRPRAARHLAACGDGPVPPGTSTFAGYLLMARALQHEQAGDPARAVAVLTQLLAPENGMMRPGLCYWLTFLVRTAMAADEHGVAAAATDLCRRHAERSTRAGNIVGARWCAGLLHGDPAPALAAADHFRAAHRRPDLGNALEDAAVLLAAAGDRNAARHTLDEALAVYTELGAIWDARRARARARPHGIRPGVRGPRRRPKTGWPALTPTELRVAELVARDRSNPDIAAELLISRHTVESHVKNILGKLLLGSRREIARSREGFPHS